MPISWNIIKRTFEYLMKIWHLINDHVTYLHYECDSISLRACLLSWHRSLIFVEFLMNSKWFFVFHQQKVEFTQMCFHSEFDFEIWNKFLKLIFTRWAVTVRRQLTYLCSVLYFNKALLFFSSIGWFKNSWARSLANENLGFTINKWRFVLFEFLR